MFTVGLTGGIGSGKSTVAECFGDVGVPVIDTDVIAHQLTAPGNVALEEIRTAFGGRVFLPEGRLDRAALRRIVFADVDARHQLEAILHPRILQAAKQARVALSAPYALIVIPLLVESRVYRQMLSRVLVVDCPADLQVSRVVARNGFTRNEALVILEAQASRSERLAIADDVIVNTASVDALRAQVVTLNQRYLALARAAPP